MESITYSKKEIKEIDELLSKMFESYWKIKEKLGTKCVRP